MSTKNYVHFKTPKYSRNSAELGIKCQSINKVSFHNKEKN